MSPPTIPTRLCQSSNGTQGNWLKASSSLWIATKGFRLHPSPLPDRCPTQAGPSMENRSSSFALIRVDGGANCSKEELSAELIEYSKSFQLVLDRVFEFSEGQFHTHGAKRLVQL